MTRAASRLVAAMGAAILLFSGGATMMASHAGAATAPPWEVGAAKDTNEVGTVALYNSSGTQVTTGSVMGSPIAAYMVGSKADTAHPKATAYMYTPKFGTAAGAWPGEQLTLSTSYPVTGAGVPSVVSGAHGPVVTGHATDESIATYIDDVANTDTTDAGYVNAYQLRVKTSTNGTYQALDIVVSGITTSGGLVTGGTWTETYPGLAPTATKTTLAVSPSSAKPGQTVTLTATESAGSKHPAGKVQFSDNKKKLGSAVAVSSAGKATLKTKLPTGKNSITATFTPTASTFASSVSAAKTVTVKAVLKNTKKPALSGPHKVGKAEKVSHGSWSPKATSYSYQWLLNGSKIKGATKSSYKLIAKDKGKKISCKVTAKKSGAISGTATSKSVKVTG
jgi:hypothetical protein